MSNLILNQRYQIQKQLGKQIGRRTFLALDLHTQQQVVVKILYLGVNFDWQDLKLFEREAETLKKLNHPAIPRYLDYFELDGDEDKGFGLVQTYVEGKSLEEHLQNGRSFSEAEVKELGKSLLNILAYLHAQNPPVIHRDIKPSNIILTNRSGNSSGEVYLVDFGSVQNLASQGGGTITVVGTYGYMPPEQFGGRTTPAADLYSLGATLIFLATGLHPTELPQKDLTIQFRELANLSTEFTDWLEWMTEPSLSKRYANAQEAIQALEHPHPRTKQIQSSSISIKQPLGSQIRLRKTREMLEIILPSTGFSIGLIAFISLLVPFALGLNIFTFPYDQPTDSSNLLASSVQIAAIACLTGTVLWGLYKRISIRINSQKLVVKHELLGIEWLATQPYLREDITRIKLKSTNIYDTGGIIQPLFLVITKKGSYCFNYSGHLTDAEIKWLVQEVSTYLGLPLGEK
ncbi:MAG TPA: serine/threonine-protein kinase [Nostocaceae cyanobacterium]|nr:serine/threonine-protein kinase [Nostocaceae cyanobacterium]